MNRVLRSRKANSCDFEPEIESQDSESLYSSHRDLRLATRSLSGSHHRDDSRSQSMTRIWSTQEETGAIAIPKVVKAQHALKHAVDTAKEIRNTDVETQCSKETPVIMTRYNSLKHKKGLSRKSV